MQWREAGSIAIDAPRERVEAVLSRWMETDPTVRRVSPERFEAGAPEMGLSTFILREERPGATRIIHARTAPMSIGKVRARDELRSEVEAELQRVERLVRAYGQP